METGRKKPVAYLSVMKNYNTNENRFISFVKSEEQAAERETKPQLDFEENINSNPTKWKNS
jgi:hypothetical protein